MRILINIVSLFLLISCQTKINKTDLKYLTGYWEIDRVVLADNSAKEYKGNTTYDYIELSDNQGFRKKVYPQLTGKFQTNNLQENFQIVENQKVIEIHYKKENETWKEILISISENSFSVKNEQNIEYFYKRITPEEN